jgi:Lrp/AsnC family transcriptional regulator for asnA, asnC and gidA
LARRRRPPDELDAAIVRLLSENGRLTNQEIARRLGSTESTVRRRVRRLMHEQGLRVVGGIGGESHQTQMVFFAHTQPGRRIEAADRLIANPRVQRIHLTTGGYDLIVYAAFDSDADALDFLVNELELADDVVSVQAGHVLKQLEPAGLRGMRAARARATSGPEAALRNFLLSAAGASDVTAVIDLACNFASWGFGVEDVAAYLKDPGEPSKSTFIGRPGLAAELDRDIQEARRTSDHQRLGSFRRLMDSHVHVYVEDTSTDPVLDGLNGIFQQAGVRSMLYLPLLTGEQLAGVLMLYSTTPRRYTDDEIVLAQAFADQLAIAIARGRARSGE